MYLLFTLDLDQLNRERGWTVTNVNNNIKLSFLGDIMCEKPLLNAWKKQKEGNTFDGLFYHVDELFKESDYIVGNLETICAGEELGYTNHIFSFNTPSDFIKAIKTGGVDLVTTATNHSLDRGITGLLRNLKNLEDQQLDSVGTYSNFEERQKVFVKNIKGLNISFLNYTYGTNVHINEFILNKNELDHICLLKPQDEEIIRLNNKKRPRTLKQRVANFIFRFITLEQWIKIKKKLGFKHNKPYQDNNLQGIDEEFLENIKQDIDKAKSNSDIVVMCMHSGGQFHTIPGKYTEHMMKFMEENGVDVVIGNHPHVVQKFDKKASGMIAAYSLGNYSISPSSVYVLHENLPEYSIMLHLYYDAQKKKCNKVSFSILKVVENEDCSLEVFPIDKLFDKLISYKEKENVISDATEIYNRFLNKNKKTIDIQREYII